MFVMKEFKESGCNELGHGLQYSKEYDHTCSTVPHSGRLMLANVSLIFLFLIASESCMVVCIEKTFLMV